jgi:glutathione-independent formaldehyde dehydrogenase
MTRRSSEHGLTGYCLTANPGTAGAIAIDDSKGSPVDQILEQTAGEGADRGCECVGYQAHGHEGHEVPNLRMNNLVASVKATGSIGVVGVFVPEGPGAEDELEQEGKLAFDFDNRDDGWTKVVLKPAG